MGEIPWYFYAVGGVAFVLTIAGVIAWNKFVENDEDEAPTPGVPQNWNAQTAGPPMPPPEPLHAWITAACGVIDGGASWMNESREAGASILTSSWGVNNGPQLLQCLQSLSREAPNAWNMVRYFRVALPGLRAGYVTPQQAWAMVRPVAQQLQRHYPSFEAIAWDYLAGLRVFYRLAPDGSQDNAEFAKYKSFIDRLRGTTWATTNYAAAL